MDTAPSRYHPPQDEWPKFLLPGVLDKIFRSELVEYFCEKNPHFAVVHPRELTDMFAKDLFSTGVTLSGCMLSYLEIHGSTTDHRGTFLNMRSLDNQLAPLILPKQKFASKFRLRFVIHFSSMLPMDSPSIELCYPRSRYLFKDRCDGVAIILAHVWLSIRLLRWRIEGQGSTRKVDVCLASCRFRDQISDFQISREMERWNGPSWVAFVLAQV
jgi:hypothetical protein